MIDCCDRSSLAPTLFPFRFLLSNDTSTSFTITKIELWPLDLPISDPFVVTGQLQIAQNAFVRLTLHDSTIGYGEDRHFPPSLVKIVRAVC